MSRCRRYCSEISTLSDLSTIVTDRLLLTPLLVDDAKEMVEVCWNSRGRPLESSSGFLFSPDDTRLWVFPAFCVGVA